MGLFNLVSLVYQHDEDYTDLLNFLFYLKYKRKLREQQQMAAMTNGSLNLPIMYNQTSELIINEEEHNHDTSGGSSYEIDELPAAIIQLLIIVLVVLIVLFLCKCNKLMSFCRYREQHKTLQELEEERYHDKMTCRDYVCFWLFQCRHRFYRRRNRRFVRKNYNMQMHVESRAGARLNYQRHSSQKLTRVGGVRKRKASILLRRRSAICQSNNGHQVPSISSASYGPASGRRRTLKKNSRYSVVASTTVINESNESVFENESTTNNQTTNVNTPTSSPTKKFERGDLIDDMIV